MPPAQASPPAPPATEDVALSELLFAMLINTGPSNDDLLNTLAEAYACPDADQWWIALEEEIQNLVANDVYEEVSISDGVTSIMFKPVFCIKFNHLGDLECYKLHIVDSHGRKA